MGLHWMFVGVVAPVASRLFSIDVSILRFINGSLFNPVLTPLFFMASLMGMGGAIWVIIALFLAFRRGKRGRRAAAAMGFALVFDLVVVESLVKNAFARTRPFAALPDINTVTLTLQSGGRLFAFQMADATHSFPSGHAFSAFACAAVLAFYYPRHRIHLYLFAAIVALSRVYLGVHYPSDIGFGAVFGIAVGWFMAWAWSKIRPLNPSAAEARCPCKSPP